MNEFVYLRQAELRLNSYDAEARTFEAVIATETPVLRQDATGPFLEVLPAAAFNLSNQNLPLLDSHNTQTVRASLGRTVSIRREGNQIVATMQLSTAEDVAPIGQRIADGTLSGISIGYRATGWNLQRQGSQRVKSPSRIELREVTLTSNPADPNAAVRQKEAIVPKDNQDLTREDQIASLRAALALPDTWGDDLPEAATEEEIRAAALEEVQKRNPPRVSIRRDNSDPAALIRRQSDALAYRMAGGTLPDDAREFVNMGFRDLAAEALARGGQSVRGMSADDVFQRAALGTSDFPLVVGNAMNKVALETYRAAETPLKSLARQRTLPNFKESTSIRLGELGRLEELTEQGEFKATSRAESGETFRLSTFGRRVDVSRKLMIDDDLGLLGDMVAALGQSAAQTEAEILVSLLIDNPALQDGTAVFDASRGNLSASSVGFEFVADARKAMRTVRGLDGKTIVGVAPKYLVVGPELETAAEEFLAVIAPAKTDDVNAFAGRLSLLVEPRIEDDRWFLFADPARMPSLQYGYLTSAQGVQIQRQEAWNTLGMSFRAFLDFGAGWIDWRGVYQSPGT